MPSITGRLIEPRDFAALREWLRDFYWCHTNRKLSLDDVANRARRDLEMNVTRNQVARERKKLKTEWEQE